VRRRHVGLVSSCLGQQLDALAADACPHLGSREREQFRVLGKKPTRGLLQLGVFGDAAERG
jgi:hypothetical protein